MQPSIQLRGVRVHNLANLDVDIPRNQLVVITGVSGSGKSSLAFDTIVAEGQRQYLETVALHARHLLPQLARPDLDSVSGLQPTVALDQRAGSVSRRSSVGTLTEIADFLRLLYARVGQAHCWKCGRPIRQQSQEQILDDLLTLPAGTKALMLSPIVRGRKGEHTETLAAIRKAGFVRARINGQVVDLDNPPKLNGRSAHTIEAVADRVVIREDQKSRLAEALQLALKFGAGLVIVCHAPPEGGQNPWTDRLYSIYHACPDCQVNAPALEPRNFSYNSPYGACPTCGGLGRTPLFDQVRVMPPGRLSPAQGGIGPWKKPTPARQAALEALAPGAWEMPLSDLGAEPLTRLWEGGGELPGVRQLLEAEYASATAAGQARLEEWRSEVVCADCQGERLNVQSRQVRIAGHSWPRLCALAAEQAAGVLRGAKWSELDLAVAEPLVEEIVKRLDFLEELGLGYLALDRGADTLSGGELQRVRLTNCLGGALVGVCYVLDEPSIGLHPRDNDRLIRFLRRLQALGNTLIVVEHDEALMRQADWLLDIGPRAGSLGGRLVAAGPPEHVATIAESLTGRYLAGELRVGGPTKRRTLDPTRRLLLCGARGNNLQNLDVAFPLGALIAVTGVSGSGKSTLVNDTLAPALLARLGEAAAAGPTAVYDRLEGAEAVDKLVRVDQAPIGRSPRGNPATYTGLFDELRRLFARTRDARRLGYTASRFSFNTKGGRCETCQGQGQRRVRMNFLPDFYVTCPECRGARFNRQTLAVRYKDLSLAQVLALSVDQALTMFANVPAVARTLTSLADVGLGYLALGQSAVTLSGGEAQRVKLATELARPDTGRTVYLLDEPTTGLHLDDVHGLLAVLRRLVDLGNTVVVIEHHVDVIRHADWIIDLGPTGGQGGGRVVAAGTPDQVANNPASVTGPWLRDIEGRVDHTSPMR